MSKLTLTLTQHLQRNSTQPVLKDAATQEWYTGGELAADVDQLKDQLRGLKVGHGDHVLVALPNVPVYPVLIQAIWELGAVVVPVAGTTTVEDLHRRMQQRVFAAYVVTPELLNAVVTAVSTVTRLQLNTAPELTLVRDQAVTGHVAATPTEADPALRLMVAQAPVTLTYAQLQRDVAATVATYQLTATDRTLLVTALTQQEAQLALLATRYVGGRVVVTQQFTASQFWPQVTDNQITHVSLRPLRLAALLRLADPSGLSTLRFMPEPASVPAWDRALRYRVSQADRRDSRFINPQKKAIMKGNAPRTAGMTPGAG